MNLVIKCFQCNVFIFKNTTKWFWHKYHKIKLFSGTISHSTSNEPKAYLEPCQRSPREQFCKHSQKPNYFCKKNSITDVRPGYKYASMNITLHLTCFRKT